MTKKKRVLLLLSVSLFLMLWFSHYLPIRVSEMLAIHYLSEQADGEDYHVTDADFSGPFDSYFVYFENEAGEKRNIGIRSRYLPFDIWFDSSHAQC